MPLSAHRFAKHDRFEQIPRPPRCPGHCRGGLGDRAAGGDAAAAGGFAAVVHDAGGDPGGAGAGGAGQSAAGLDAGAGFCPRAFAEDRGGADRPAAEPGRPGSARCAGVSPGAAGGARRARHHTIAGPAGRRGAALGYPAGRRYVDLRCFGHCRDRAGAEGEKRRDLLRRCLYCPDRPDRDRALSLGTESPVRHTRADRLCHGRGHPRHRPGDRGGGPARAGLERGRHAGCRHRRQADAQRRHARDDPRAGVVLLAPARGRLGEGQAAAVHRRLHCSLRRTQRHRRPARPRPRAVERHPGRDRPGLDVRLRHGHGGPGHDRPAVGIESARLEPAVAAVGAAAVMFGVAVWWV